MQEAFKRLRPEWLSAAVPGLHITDLDRRSNASARPMTALPGAEDDELRFRRPLASRGWSELGGLATDAEAHALAGAIEQLIDNGLPPITVYAFDEAWQLGLRVRDRISRMLGRPYLLVEDIWAFFIEPGASGWPAHRGITTDLLDREAPEFLNVWIALGDVPVDRSCMHFLPLDSDPRYPLELDASVDATSTDATAAPVDAGTALVWNANTLHWGGPCAPNAGAPRVSCTFSLRRSDSTAVGPANALDERSLAPWQRIDIIARQITIYGDDERDLSDAVRMWATTTAALSARMTPT